MSTLSHVSALLRGLVLLSALGLGACQKANPPEGGGGTAASPTAAGTTVAQADKPSTPPAATPEPATPAPGSAPVATPTPAPTPTPAATPPAAQGGADKSAAGGSSLYKVVDGTKVDKDTMDGFRAWRSAACDRCHGPNQEGMVGPSLIESLKKLSKDEFKTTVLEGRLEKGMPAFKTNEQVVKNIDHLYAYLKGRSDGAITSAKVSEIN